MPNALVIGLGSIGRRHVRILRELGCQTAAVSSQSESAIPVYTSVREGVDGWNPGYVVIASPTAHHSQDLRAVLNSSFRGPILVEKPLFGFYETVDYFGSQLICVGYNLRFLSVIQRLRNLVSTHKILSAHLFNSEYLPNWRPQRDYRDTSSAKRTLGGGVLRDLSHEIDFLHYLQGTPRAVSAAIRQTGTLDIETEDSAHALLEHQDGSISTFSLSYLDRVRRREIHITTSTQTFHANLLDGKLYVGNDVENCFTERDDTFRMMHRDVMSGVPSKTCTLSEGLDVVKTIEMLEKSSRTQKWVTR